MGKTAQRRERNTTTIKIFKRYIQQLKVSSKFQNVQELHILTQNFQEIHTTT